jgi:hypothetical protein
MEQSKETDLIQTSTESNNSIVKFDHFQNTNEMLSFAELLIKSKLLPQTLKTPEAVVSIILQGKELGFSSMTSLNNLNNIQGKVTLGIHAIAALLKKRNIRYKLLQDFADVWGKNKDGEEIVVDKVTSFIFMERWGDQIIENTIPYYWTDAVKAGLSTRDNWIKQPRIMMRTRALAIGSRLAAPDALLGVYETSEWADVVNATYEIDENGNANLK